MDDVAFPSVRGRREVLELDELARYCVGTKFKMPATTPQARVEVHIQHREYETLANNIVLQPRRIPGGSLNQVRFARVCFSVGMSYSFCRATACFFPHHLVCVEKSTLCHVRGGIFGGRLLAQTTGCP